MKSSVKLDYLTSHSPENITSYFVESFHIEDVTEDSQKLQKAYDIVVNRYSELSSSKLDYQDVYADLCNKEIYNKSYLSRILLLSGLNPDTNTIEALGTVRVSCRIQNSNKKVDYPLEAMELVSPKGGWDNFSVEDFNPNLSCEIGRLAVISFSKDGFARKINFPKLIARKLVIQAIKLTASYFDKKQSWGIMGRYVVNVLNSSELQLLQIHKVQLNLTETNLQLFQKYNKYWFHSNPQFYKMIITDTNLN